MILSKEKTPSYWEIVPLGDICLKATKVKRKEVDIEKELIYLDIGSINNVTNRITEHKVYQWKDAPSRAQQIVQVGDILFSTVRVYLRNIAKIDNPLYENQICSSGFTVVRGNRGCCDPKYLFAVTLYEGFLQPLNELQTGTSYPAVRDSDVFSQLIPLPPLPEQRAIVSKIEQLFSKLDNGISNLKLAQEQLKVYRQAVLKKAFEGEFTKGLRQSLNLPKIEKLTLEQITLPKIGLRRGPFGSAIKKSFFVSEGYKVYEQGNAINDDPYRGHYYISEEKYLELKNFEVIPSDLLVSCSGVTLGRIVEMPEDIEKGVINQALLRIRLKRDLINSRYFVHLFRSAEFQKMIFAKSQGSAMPNLVGIKEFKLIPLNVPSLAEQQAIVQEIETRLSVCDKIEQDIETNLEKAEALRQSILKKAFEGKLLSEKELAEVRGAEDWEPAEVLLERIKAEKAGNGKKEKPATEKLKSIIQEDKGIIQQATLQVFEQIDK